MKGRGAVTRINALSIQALPQLPPYHLLYLNLCDWSIRARRLWGRGLEGSLQSGDGLQTNRDGRNCVKGTYKGRGGGGGRGGRREKGGDGDEGGRDSQQYGMETAVQSMIS